jgi:hypothetical protein
MPATSTADSKDAKGEKIESATDPQVTKPSSTHSDVMGEVSPRLPHEHDESSDSGSRNPDPVIEQAAKDVQSGKQQTDKGETTDQVYQKNLRGSAGNG